MNSASGSATAGQDAFQTGTSATRSGLNINTLYNVWVRARGDGHDARRMEPASVGRGEYGELRAHSGRDADTDAGAHTGTNAGADGYATA